MFECNRSCSITYCYISRCSAETAKINLLICRFMLYCVFYNNWANPRALVGRELWSTRVYTMMWMLRALWLVLAHDLLEYRYMDDVTGNLFSLFCSTWHAVLKMFVRLFRIEASESFGKSLAGAIYKEEKWRNGDQKSYWLLAETHKGLKRVTRVQRSWIFTFTIFGNLSCRYPF